MRAPATSDSRSMYCITMPLWNVFSQTTPVGLKHVALPERANMALHTTTWVTSESKFSGTSGHTLQYLAEEAPRGVRSPFTPIPRRAGRPQAADPRRDAESAPKSRPGQGAGSRGGGVGGGRRIYKASQRCGLQVS